MGFRRKREKDEDGEVARWDMMQRLGLCTGRKCGRKDFERCRNPEPSGTMWTCGGPKLDWKNLGSAETACAGSTGRETGAS